ncbi:type I-C CRISPR-associated protein Cas8c/Csd1 [Kitasatospora cineracea]|uniref:type I-C CRISPR-associated protein Cas8c/Csd1 n=1 Tax=Kitasatospora cineracea TaxID=88074 RepID=UPI00342BADAC
MLLQRLTEQAGRLEGLPPEFYRYRQIDWVLMVTTGGAAPKLVDRRPPAKARADAVVEAVPYVQRSGTKVPPFLVVDTAEFVLGRPRGATDEQGPAEKDVAEAARRRGEYLALLRRWAAEASDEPSAALVLDVLTRGVPADKSWEGLEARHTVAVLVDGRWLHERASVRELWARVVRERKGAGGGQQELCLVCGEPGDLLSTIPEPIKKGAIPSTGGSNEAQLISVNSPAQGRGAAVKLVNTPVCDRCGGRAMAALNNMLASDDHRRSLGDGVLLWWTREPLDEALFDLVYDNYPDSQAVAHLIDSLHHRPDPAAADRIEPNDFYALTLGLNNARTVVREWLDIPVRTVKANLGAWFEDHGVFDGWRGTTRYLPLWLLALATGRHNGTQYAKGTAPRGIERELLRTALHRTPPPAYLLPHLLQRIRADHRIDVPRTALLRLALNRSHDRTDRPMPRLDPDSTDPAYLCGRAFAVLEAIQTAALPDVKATIADKYFGTAMTAPAAVLANLRHGANAHLKRLRRDKRGAHLVLNERLAQVFGAFTDDLPTHLSPREQARFVIGYEQQRAADFAARAAAKAAKAAEAVPNSPDEPAS